METTTTTKDTAKETLVAFAISLEATLGTEDTTRLLRRLTKFVNETPESVLKLRNAVQKDEARFDEMLTRRGFEEITDLVAMVESGDVMSMFMK